LLIGHQAKKAARVSSPYSASNSTIHFWAVGAMSDYMLFVAFNALILPIFTTGFGMDPRMVGWALTLPRIADALIDPLLGHFSDNLRSRWGRRRPLLAISALLGAAMLVLMWWPSRDWGEMAKFAWLLGTSILLYFSYGMYSMSHLALGYELSDDYHIRTRVMAVRGMYFSITAMAGGWLYWLALRPQFGDEITGIRWISVGLAAVIVGATAITIRNTQERVQYTNRTHVPLWPAIRAALRIRPFVIILLLRIAQTLSVSLYASIGFFIGAYYVCGGDKALYSSLSGINGMVGFATAFALVPLSTWLSRRLGKRDGIIWGFVVVLAGAAVMPLCNQPGMPYLLLTHMILFGVLAAVLNLFMSAVIPDICDLDELASGERREGLFSAVMSFVSKIENSLCILASSYLVAWAGFDIAKGADQPPEVLTRLLWYGFAPKVVFSAVALGLALYFPLTQRMMADVRAQLDERHRMAGKA
jgi:glycoside/pentoside/hexuronide:cation symporter, GPH family